MFLAVLGSEMMWSPDSIFPVRGRKILTFLLGIYVHNTSSVVSMVSDSSVWTMWSVTWSQNLSALGFVHLQKVVIICWIKAHIWYMLLCLHLIFAGVSSNHCHVLMQSQGPSLAHYIPGTDPGSCSLNLSYTQCWHLCLATSILTAGCFSKAFKEQLLCLTERSVRKIKKCCNDSI